MKFDYPGDWIPTKAQTALLDVCPPPKTAKGEASFSLDVPKLPWHIPGMITAGMVESGYVKDLKKNDIHDAQVDESVAVNVCGCWGRRVKCSGHENGKEMSDVAVILVHNDRVYIFSCDGDTNGYAAARSALDEAVGSLQWK